MIRKKSESVIWYDSDESRIRIRCLFFRNTDHEL